MPTSELVRYSGLPKKKSTAVDILRNSDSSSFGSGGEDWITRKRVETKTVKNIEKRIQRQVVLEDGRVIEEDDPEVTVDTIEDVESHSDDCDDDVKHIGSLVHVPANGSPSPWAPGYNIVGDKLQRNIFTKKFEQKSVTTACANNLGDISIKDIDGVIKRGKKAASVAKTKGYTEDPGRIAAKVIHRDASRNKTVDVEDIQEIDQMNAQGHLQTHRVVNRECIEDKQDETPSDGESTEETESRDGDRDAFSQRKEDRTIDYYKVQKGKSMKEAKLIRRGLHMTSYDKNDQCGGALNYTQPRALKYDSDSTTNSGQVVHRRPPRQERPHSRATGGRNNASRYSSSEREDPRRFHTIESTSYKPFGVRRDSEDSKSYRSRSMSRSPQYAEVKRDLKASKGLNKSTGNILREDLDTERAGRLRRAMSFKDNSRIGSEVNSERSSSGPKPSFLDTMKKSLYATLSKAAMSTKSKAPAMDHPGSPPKRPPRKPRSQSSMSDHHRSMSSLAYKSIEHQQPQHQPRGSNKATFEGRSWDMHSTASSTLPRSSRPSVTPSRPTPTPRGGAQKTRLSISGASNRSSSMEPSMVHGFRENRDPPKFERKRDNTNRFFGQSGFNEDDSEVVERSKPPPDMRRYLLDNLSKKPSSVHVKQPSVISAM